jgi:hypothetical protein
MSESPLSRARALAYRIQEIVGGMLFSNPPGGRLDATAELRAALRQLDDCRQDAADVSGTDPSLKRDLERAFRELLLACQELVEWAFERTPRLQALYTAAFGQGIPSPGDPEGDRRIAEYNEVAIPAVRQHNEVLRPALFRASDAMSCLESRWPVPRPEGAAAPPEQPQAASAKPRKRRPGPRITTDSDTNEVILDGAPTKIKDKVVFRLFAALVDAHNNRQTPIARHALFEAIGRSRNKDPRPERHFKKLPPDLRALVQTDSVCGGGFFLSLPAAK